MKPKCGIYCRVSTSSQSIESQLESLENSRKKLGFKLYDVYTDEGISGMLSEDNRSGYKKLLEDMRNKKFDILLVEEQDRITRDDDIEEWAKM